MLLESLQGKNDDILKYNIVLQISSFNLYLKLIFKSNILQYLAAVNQIAAFFMTLYQQCAFIRKNKQLFVGIVILKSS